MCISEALAQDMSREAEVQGVSWSAMTATLLAEAFNMRRVPGVIIVDGPARQRAMVSDSGLDVCEIIITWQTCGYDERQLAANDPWLTAPQLRATLVYHELR